MRKTKSYLLAFVLANFMTIALHAQNVSISGKVENSVTKEKVAAVTVTEKGTNAGTYTDDNGSFKITVSKLPATLLISSIGFELQEITVNSAAEKVSVSFKPSNVLGQEVVVSASRLPEKILESPVTIERFGTANIRNTPAPNYYDIVKTFKGVDVVNSSLTFTSVTTRGFNGSGNTRFNQFVDGMDNQAPGLNFSVGSIVGPTELDVDNVELLPGASSALYGSGGMNGTMLISSKNPFKYQGLSIQAKQGVMHVGNSDDPVKASPYYDASLRWGKKISENFAFKIGAQYIQAKDWVGTNKSNYTGVGTAGKPKAGDATTDPNYDGVNVYGDENPANVDMKSVATAVQNQTRGGILQATGGTVDIVALMNGALPANATQAQIGGFIGALPAALQGPVTNLVPFYFGLRNNIIPAQLISRTGYNENEIIDPVTKVLKLSGGLYFKLSPKTELSAIANYGTGNSVYTGSDRYSLKNLKIGQYKLEIKNDDWFFKAYTTLENSGDAFNSTVAIQLFNEAWKPTQLWAPQYVGTYVQTIAGGGSQALAYANARAYADQGRPAAGTAQFQHIFDSVANIPIPKGGRFLDRTNLYHVEGQYNLSKLVKVAEVLVGANWRQYRLNSQGTLFADTSGPISTNEFGAYVQVSKKFANDKLKLTASGRYDKNTNFEGKFTPRFSAVVTVAPNHFIRASYQNAYRFPSNQNQWINLNTGAGVLIGGIPSLRDFYHFNTNPVYTAPSIGAFYTDLLTTGVPKPALLKVQNFDTYKPESVNSYELGYKGVANKKLLIDLYGYYSEYKNFIGRINAAQFKNPLDPTKGYTGYSISVNSANKVNTYGFGIGLNYLLPKSFVLDFNFSSDKIDNGDPNFADYFNTPNYRTNIGIANSGFGYDRRFGFNVQYRWQDTYNTVSDFKQGPVSAISTLDAQISYKLKAAKSVVKLGATNLLNTYYVTQYGNPAMGGLYYVSFGYNVF